MQTGNYSWKNHFFQIEPICSKLQEEDANDEDGEEGGDVEEDNKDDEDTLLDLDLDEVRMTLELCYDHCDNIKALNCL